MSRIFLPLPALRTREDVQAYCDRLGAVSAASQYAIDGWRCLAEVPEVAIARIANEAREVERRALGLRETAEATHGQETAKVPATGTPSSQVGIVAGSREDEFASWKRVYNPSQSERRDIPAGHRDVRWLATRGSQRE